MFGRIRFTHISVVVCLLTLGALGALAQCTRAHGVIQS